LLCLRFFFSQQFSTHGTFHCWTLWLSRSKGCCFR